MTYDMERWKMDFVSQNIAVNLKRLRRARRLTLDDVAEQTGVSKSMLGQIERGDSNPTIGTVSSDRNHDYINGGKGVLRITSFFTFGSNE